MNGSYEGSAHLRTPDRDEYAASRYAGFPVIARGSVANAPLGPAGVQKHGIFSDVTSGAKSVVTRRNRGNLLEYAALGNIVVVWRIDRLWHSFLDVLSTIDHSHG
jgi:hypothetical protein